MRTQPTEREGRYGQLSRPFAKNRACHIRQASLRPTNRGCGPGAPALWYWELLERLIAVLLTLSHAHTRQTSCNLTRRYLDRDPVGSGQRQSQRPGGCCYDIAFEEAKAWLAVEQPARADRFCNPKTSVRARKHGATFCSDDEIIVALGTAFGHIASSPSHRKDRSRSHHAQRSASLVASA